MQEQWNLPREPNRDFAAVKFSPENIIKETINRQMHKLKSRLFSLIVIKLDLFILYLYYIFSKDITNKKGHNLWKTN